MSINFREKSTINRKLLDTLLLRMCDKDEQVIEWPGKRYYETEPSQLSFVGSIGHLPNPEFQGPQPPNSMGMVLLVTPDKHNRIEVEISGRFDITHRVMPELKEMRKHLKTEGSKPKETQVIYNSYKRYTVHFESVVLSCTLPDEINTWITPEPLNGLSDAIASLEERCIDDPEVYRACKQEVAAPKISIDWDDSIQTQNELIEVIQNTVFGNLKDILHYSVQIRARARSIPSSISEIEGTVLLEIFIENTTTRDEAKKFGISNGAHLLDVQFSTELVNGTGHQLPHKLTPADYRHLIHSTVPGYGITTSVSQDTDGIYHTIAMPVSALPKTINPDPISLGMTRPPSFKNLSSKPVPLLDSLVSAIRQYGNKWKLEIAQLKSEGKQEEASVALEEREQLLQEADNIEDGVKLLAAHEQLQRAFCWMNEVMAGSFKQQNKDISSWRLFQLGFILTQVRAVYERTCDESELTDHINTAEVLWFATGGGKTEAYFGILIMNLFYERLKGREYGTSAWMKFPLRMLSVQQFQRLAYVVAQANRIKVRESISGHPYTIGYFTGDGTPSYISNSYQSYEDNYLPNLSLKDLQKWKFISDCPYCNAENSVTVQRDLKRTRIYHICSNPECWSNTEESAGEYGEGIKGELGIFVSDEEVYRYIPSILVGTIDKLAVISHNKNFRVLFGGATHYCPDHGFIVGGKCTYPILEQESNGEYRSVPCPNNSRSPKPGAKTVKLTPETFPGVQFILQDELHLLSENTGNFAAHYETLMSTLQVANKGRPPKVLSATATIKGYSDHIHHLYLRKARRFPVPGIHHGESFYSRTDSDEQGELIQRWYAGILPLGGGAVVARTSAIISSRFITLVDDLREGLVSDPEKYTAMLGMAPSQAPEVRGFVSTFLNTSLIYNNSIKGNTDIHRGLEEYQVPKYPDRRWHTLDATCSLDEIQQIITQVETKEEDDPSRQLIATSVVSHGVDMSRLNFLIVAGWPKSIAEYMQSSARSGRAQPGIVLSVYNFKALYQATVFLNFEDYHRFLDRLVETVPINRLAPKIIERTLPGVFAALVLNWMASQPYVKSPINNGEKVKAILSDTTNKSFDEMRKLMNDSLSVPTHLESEFDPRVVKDFKNQLDSQITKLLDIFANLPSKYSTEQLSSAIGKVMGNSPMRNFRDIENQIEISPKGDTEDLIKGLGGRK